jgi:hypothetical protein
MNDKTTIEVTNTGMRREEKRKGGRRAQKR